jgi:hypothetical protein
MKADVTMGVSMIERKKPQNPIRLRRRVNAAIAHRIR